MCLSANNCSCAFLINTFYDSPTSRNKADCSTEQGSDTPLSSVKIDSLATSGEIPESLDEAARLARASGIIEEIGMPDSSVNVRLPNESLERFVDRIISAREHRSARVS